MKRFTLIAAALLAVGGCARESKTESTSESLANATEETFESAWAGLLEVGDETGEAAGEVGDELGDAGEWTVEHTKDGAYRVWRTTERVGGKAGQEIGDAAVLSAIKGRLAADTDVDAHQIDVDVDEGTVELSGTVDDAREAAKAVRIAAGTRGVDEVYSRLTW